MTRHPDIVIVNGRVLTMNDAALRAEALAIANGTIIAVGGNDDIRALKGPATREIDAGGATVMPGLIDSHVHLFQGSAELDFLPLGAIRGKAALAKALLAYAEANSAEPMIVGTGAMYGILETGHTPTRHDIDAIIVDRPVAIIAADLHTVWANTMALEKAGLLHGAPMPEGSIVVMGDDGKATGELLETGAFGPVLKLSRTGGRDMLGYVTGDNPVPPATLAERAQDKALLAKGLKHCAAHGITTMHNMDGNFYQLELLQELDEARDLPCRMQVPFHLKNTDPLDRLQEAGEMHRQYASDMVWSGRVKMFMDGVMESRTSLMLRDFPDSPGNTGEAVFAPEPFNEACVIADAMELQISVHAIGDLAIRRTLDGYELARKKNGMRDSRHRIEHLEVMHPDDLPRLKSLGVVASIQPIHAAFAGFFDPPLPDTVLYPDQIPYAFAWRKIRDTGAPVVFSTDWPVAPLNPFRNIQAATAPIDLGPEWPDQSQSLMETLASYTRGNAYVEFNEARKGQIATGMMADIVILSGDIEAMEPSKIGTMKAAMTICNGRITFEA